jgi:hypothetical protein
MKKSIVDNLEQLGVVLFQTFSMGTFEPRNSAGPARALSMRNTRGPRRWGRPWNQPSWRRRVGIELTRQDQDLEETKKNRSGAVKVLVQNGKPITDEGAALLKP